MSKLLLRPKKHPDECPVSYLIRVAEKNGFKHIGYMLRYAGLPWKNLRVPSYRILAGEYNVEPYYHELGLEYCPPRSSDVYASARAAALSTKIFVKTPKICPLCINELGYCKDLWAYLMYNACHIHRIMLVDADPQLNTRLSWYRGSLNKFTHSDPTEISDQQIAPAEAVMMSRIMAYLIEKQPTPKSTPAILKDLSFIETASILHFITHYQYRLLNKTLFTPALMDNLTASHHYIEAWKSLKCWPKSFHLLLSQYIDNPMSYRGQAGINKHFRDIHEKLHRQRMNEGIIRIRSAFDQYIDLCWPNALQANRLSRISISSEQRSLISLKEVQNMLQCREERIRKFIQQNLLHPHYFKSHTYFMRDEVQTIVDRISNNWTMDQASNELELSRYQLKQLLDANLIKTLQCPDSKNRDWLIDKNFWLKTIESFKNKSVSHGIKDGMSLKDLQRKGFDIVDTFRLIESGNVMFKFRSKKEKPYSFSQLKKFYINKL